MKYLWMIVVVSLGAIAGGMILIETGEYDALSTRVWSAAASGMIEQPRLLVNAAIYGPDRPLFAGIVIISMGFMFAIMTSCIFAVMFLLGRISDRAPKRGLRLTTKEVGVEGAKTRRVERVVALDLDGRDDGASRSAERLLRLRTTATRLSKFLAPVLKAAVAAVIGGVADMSRRRSQGAGVGASEMAKPGAETTDLDGDAINALRDWYADVRGSRKDPIEMASAASRIISRIGPSERALIVEASGMEGEVMLRAAKNWAERASGGAAISVGAPHKKDPAFWRAAILASNAELKKERDAVAAPGTGPGVARNDEIEDDDIDRSDEIFDDVGVIAARLGLMDDDDDVGEIPSESGEEEADADVFEDLGMIEKLARNMEIRSVDDDAFSEGRDGKRVADDSSTRSRVDASGALPAIVHEASGEGEESRLADVVGDLFEACRVAEDVSAGFEEWPESMQEEEARREFVLGAMMDVRAILKSIGVERLEVILLENDGVARWEWLARNIGSINGEGQEILSIVVGGVDAGSDDADDLQADTAHQEAGGLDAIASLEAMATAAQDGAVAGGECGAAMEIDRPVATENASVEEMFEVDEAGPLLQGWAVIARSMGAKQAEIGRMIKQKVGDKFRTAGIAQVHMPFAAEIGPESLCVFTRTIPGGAWRLSSEESSIRVVDGAGRFIECKRSLSHHSTLGKSRVVLHFHGADTIEGLENPVLEDGVLVTGRMLSESEIQEFISA